MPETYVVVGAGQSGSRAADSLRKAGFKGRLILVGAEPYLPYQRPPLCKRYLVNDMPMERLVLRHRSFYDRSGIELRLNTEVTAIDPDRHSIELAEGGELSYDKLLLCLGARARRFDVPGNNLAGIHVVRTFDHARAFRRELAPGSRLVIIGGGYIGLETAATARALDLDVTVIEVADHLMPRVASPITSSFYLRRHTEAGVKFMLNAAARGFTGTDRVHAVQMADGPDVRADIVMISIGNIPAVELAAAAGLECHDGIVVDQHCRTSEPDIWAAGDCTHHPNLRYGRRMRLQSIDNAIEQARVAAADMHGREALHAHVPWFWSDQYDTKLQIAGIADGYDELITRGDPDSGTFSVWLLRSGELLAMETVNRPLEFMQAGKWIAAHKTLDTRRLKDSAIDLGTI